MGDTRGVDRRFQGGKWISLSGFPRGKWLWKLDQDRAPLRRAPPECRETVQKTQPAATRTDLAFRSSKVNMG